MRSKTKWTERWVSRNCESTSSWLDVAPTIVAWKRVNDHLHEYLIDACHEYKLSIWGQGNSDRPRCAFPFLVSSNSCTSQRSLTQRVNREPDIVQDLTRKLVPMLGTNARNKCQLTTPPQSSISSLLQILRRYRTLKTWNIRNSELEMSSSKPKPKHLLIYQFSDKDRATIAQSRH